MLRNSVIPYEVLQFSNIISMFLFSSTARVLRSFRIWREGHAGYQRSAIYDSIPYDDKGEPSSYGEDTFN